MLLWSSAGKCKLPNTNWLHFVFLNFILNHSLAGVPVANGPSNMMNSLPNQGPKVPSQNGQINRMPYQNQPLHGFPTAGPPQPSKPNPGQPLSFGPPSGPNSLPNQPQMQVRPQGGLQYNAAPPTNIGAPPTRMGAPPAKIGPPPTSIGAPPTNIGAPPNNIAAPPSGMVAPAMETGPPKSNLGGLPKGIIGPPTSLQGPSNVGLPSSSGGSLTQTRTGPPATSSSSGQPVFDPETGTWQYPSAQGMFANSIYLFCRMYTVHNYAALYPQEMAAHFENLLKAMLIFSSF